MMKMFLDRTKLSLFPCRENEYKPLLLSGRFFSYLTISILILRVFNFSFLTLMPKSSYFADLSRGLLIQMTNDERSRVGLSPLQENEELFRAAEMKADDMLKRDYFSHWSPSGVSPWYWISLAGYNYSYAGENLAIGFLNAKDIHDAWLASPEHKKNILSSNYGDIGIAVREGEFYGQKTYLVVQVFGSKRSPLPVIELAQDEAEEIVEEEALLEEELVLEEELPLSIIPSVLGDNFITNPIEGLEAKHQLFKFLTTDYGRIIDQITVFSLIFLSALLLGTIFVRFDIQHPSIVIKGVALMLIIFAIDYLDHYLLSKIIINSPWIG